MSPFLLEGEYVLVYDLQISIAALEFTHDMYAFFMWQLSKQVNTTGYKKQIYHKEYISVELSNTHKNKNLIYTHLKCKADSGDVTLTCDSVIPRE